MNVQRIISQEIFDAMVFGAVEDLRRSGLNSGDIFSIIEAQFGPRYAALFCGESAAEAEYL